MRLSLRSAHECAAPAATCTKAVPFGGALWPDSLRPQQAIEPSIRTAQL